MEQLIASILLSIVQSSISTPATQQDVKQQLEAPTGLYAQVVAPPSPREIATQADVVILRRPERNQY